LKKFEKTYDQVLDIIYRRVKRELETLRSVEFTDDRIAKMNSRVIYFYGDELLIIEKEYKNKEIK
jgi:hypothetical protein